MVLQSSRPAASLIDHGRAPGADATAAPGIDPAYPADPETWMARPTMGGTLTVGVAHPPDEAARARSDLRRVADRVDAWAARLTRFDERSDLCALNRDPTRSRTHVRPTLGSVLEAAHRLAIRSEGIIDVRLLDERLAAETGAAAPMPPGRWWVDAGSRSRPVGREGRVRFDLDGVAKGWIADRALALLDPYPAAMVDADGDIALRLPAGSTWQVGIADPFADDVDLVVLAVPDSWPERTLGIATSGTSVHRWTGGTGPTHHLIDPRTRRPARTDVVQATVVAESASVAEALAKAAVIAGSEEGLELHARSGAWASVLLLESGELIASPATTSWLA